MRDRTPRLSPQRAQMLRGHCQYFSHLGWALFAQMLTMLAVQSAVTLAVRFLAPWLLYNSVFLWLLSVLSVYGVSFPVFCVVIRNVPAPARTGERAPLGPVRLLQVYLMAMAALYLANYATLALLWVVGLFRGAPVYNPVETIQSYPTALNLLLGCVIAPAAEECMFRGLLLDRLRPYGDKFAVCASALCFGLFHGNLSQMFYACAIGLIFGYVALRTGTLWQTILLHAMVNFVSTGLLPLLERAGEAGIALLGLFILGCIVLGAVFLVVRRRELRFAPGAFGFTEGRKWRLFFETPGVICFLLLSAVLAGSYLALS